MSAVSNPGPYAGAEVGSRPWLHAFALATRSVTLEAYRPRNTCIATTLLGCGALARFDIKATPTAVWAEAINTKAYRLREEGVHPSLWPDDAWSVVIRNGARATDVVADNRTGGWDGHLVIVLRRGAGNPRTLIDLTADQFDRPAHDLHVDGPVFMDIPAGATWAPDEPFGAPAGPASENRTFVQYAPAPTADPVVRAWRDSPDATRIGIPGTAEGVDPEGTQVLVEEIVARIEALTAAP